MSGKNDENFYGDDEEEEDRKCPPNYHGSRSNPKKAGKKEDASLSFEEEEQEDTKLPPQNVARFYPNEERESDKPAESHKHNEDKRKHHKHARKHHEHKHTKHPSMEENSDHHKRKHQSIAPKVAQSPPPNVSQFDPNTVGLNEEFDEEEKMEATEEDPPDGHISGSSFSEGWATFDSWFTDAPAFDPNERIDDIEDPGMSTGDKVMIAHLRGPDESPGAESVERQQADPPNVPPQRPRHVFPPTQPGAQWVDGPGYTGHEDDNFTVTINDEEEGTLELSPPTVSAQLVNMEEEENRVLQNFLQNTVVADILPKVAPDIVPKVAPDNSSRRWKLVSIFLVLILIIIGVVLGITLRPDPDPTLSPEALTDLLSSVSSDEGEALRNSSTPQNMAFNWMTTNNTHLGTLSNEQIIQKYALAMLYFSANGDSWNVNEFWLEGKEGDEECGRWQSIDGPALGCTGGGAVSELDLFSNNLKGQLPPEIGLLTELATLQLWSNTLTGQIPTEIGLLTFLDTLWLSNNTLTGPIPTEIGLLTELGSLALDINRLTGTVPTEINSLTNLNELYLDNNMFTGNYTCPDFIEECWISCELDFEFDGNLDVPACRSL